MMPEAEKKAKWINEISRLPSVVARGRGK